MAWEEFYSFTVINKSMYLHKYADWDHPRSTCHAVIMGVIGPAYLVTSYIAPTLNKYEYSFKKI